MSASLADLAGTKTRSVTVAGVSYTLAQLNLGQFGKLEDFLRNQPILRAKDRVDKLPLPEDARRIIWEGAVKESEGVFLGSEGFNAGLKSFPAICEMLALSIETHHPQVTREMIQKSVTFEDVPGIQQAFNELNMKQKAKSNGATADGDSTDDDAKK
jgi:hypothetical protein